MKNRDISNLLEKYNKQVWVMYNNEGTDMFFNKYIYPNFETSSICILTKNESYLIISSLDKDNINKELESKYCIYIYENENDLMEALDDIVGKIKFPKDISFSYSTIGDLSTDILTHGNYVYITNLIRKIYKKYSKKIIFSSAENIIYDLESQKSVTQLDRLRYLAKLSDNILKCTFESIKIGMSEKEIVVLTRKITDKFLMNLISKNERNIVGYDMAWNDCPIVLVGENLAKGGHSLPSDKKLAKGETIYFDFGVRVHFEDGEILYTDIQRMGYAIKDNEKNVPKSVMKVFTTLISSIDDGIENLKPGIKGYEIDKIVRNRILKSGYPDYNHATGHPVGLKVHDIGTVISKKGNKRANLELIENGVYTLEPRVNIPNGGSIEEMIQVTKYGGVPLCNTQKELYIVK